MDYLKLIDEYKEEIIESLKELVAIRSVVEPEIIVKKARSNTNKISNNNQAEMEKLPFGRGVHEAFIYMMNKANADGFDVQNIDNYGGHVEFGGYTRDQEGEIIATSDEIFGILGHLDIVPEGGNWDYDPFAGVVEDGKIYGRGTSDDKGPLLAAYYAMKAIKNSGIEPQNKVRLILGLDEETKWEGMKYYLSKVKAPNLGFTPDSDFPAIHGEMGILVFEIAKKFGKSTNKGLELRTLIGGNAPNMVPDSARAVLRAEKIEEYEKIKMMVSEYRNAETEKEEGQEDKKNCVGNRPENFKIKAKGVGKSLEIFVQGVSAHGAAPEKGVNAISVIMDFLGRLNFVNEDAIDFINFYNKHIGFELHGESFGCDLCDEPSGKLILNVGQVNFDSKSGILTINVRYPVTNKEEDVYDAILPVINKYNMGIVKVKHRQPIYIPEDDPLIINLMNVYKKYTGDLDSKPVVSAGGTYARAASNIVAFGPAFPGDEDVVHQKNEYIEIEKLMLCTKIYAEAIVNCVPH